MSDTVPGALSRAGHRRRWIAALVLLTLALGAGLYRQRGNVVMALKPVIVDAFHWVYYRSADSTWNNTNWLGTKVLKNPLDMWVFQEIVNETRPDVIVEAGTFWGGSALYLANLFDLLGHGQVVTIDIEEMKGRPRHPRIHYLLGSSTAPEIVAEVKSFLSPQDKVMVILDSDHHKPHVLQELKIYSQLVTKGSYLIVEDTDINGHPVFRSFGPGPMEAIEEFMQTNSDFVADRSREKFLMTHNPKGYLRRIR